MRKLITVLSLTFGLFLSTTALVACGGNDENESGKIVDGVNVTTGKKLLEVIMEKDGFPTMKYKMIYDSIGRISKILFIVPERGKTYSEITYEKLLIDYELRVVKILHIGYYNSYYSYGFILNEDGFVSQLGTCTMKYNSKGYLVDVEEPNVINTLTFDGNDLIEASVSNMRHGNMTLYYATYGNIDNQGDLYFSIKRDIKPYIEGNDYDWLVINKNVIPFFLIYQSGLFGKVNERVMNFKNKNVASSLIDYVDNVYSYSFKMTFISE